MERMKSWYWLQLKSCIKHKIYWLQAVGMGFLVLVMLNISFPSDENVLAGIYNADGGYADQLMRSLNKTKCFLTYIIYEDEQAMQQDVLSGRLECGFTLEKGFEEKIKKGEQRDIVTFFCTPLSTKKALFQENFYARLLAYYSDWLLEQSEEEIYGQQSEAITEALREKNEKYLTSDAIFHMEIKQAADKGNRQLKNEQKQSGGLTYPIQGTVAAVWLMGMLMVKGRRFEAKTGAVYKALNKEEGQLFEIAGYLAYMTIMAFTGFLLIIFSSVSRGFFKELICLIAFMAVSSVWLILAGNLLKNRTSFGAWIITLLLINLLAAPAFIDLSVYLPGIRYVRYLLPIGVYLQI